MFLLFSVPALNALYFYNHQFRASKKEMLPCEIVSFFDRSPKYKPDILICECSGITKTFKKKFQKKNIRNIKEMTLQVSQGALGFYVIESTTFKFQ